MAKIINSGIFRLILLVGLYLLNSIPSFGQKPPIGAEAIKTWPSLGGAMISDDGKFVAYNLENVPLGHKTMVIQSVDSKSKREFVDVKYYSHKFICKGKYSIFKTNGDSLALFELGTSRLEFIADVSTFLVSNNCFDDYLAYKEKGLGNQVVIRKLGDKSESRLDNIGYFTFVNDNKSLLYQKKNSSNQNTDLIILNLQNQQSIKIWSGSEPGNYIFSDDGRQLAFSSTQAGQSKAFWRYVNSAKTAMKIADNYLVPEGMILSGISKFSEDGKFLFVQLKKALNGTEGAIDNARLKVWSYTDEVLQSERNSRNIIRTYLAVVIFDNQFRSKIKCLEDDNEKCIGFLGSNILVERRFGEGESAELLWSKGSSRGFYLKSLLSESNQLVTDEATYLVPNISPKQKFIVYFNPRTQNYHSFEILTGITRNITKELANIKWTQLNDDYNIASFNIAGWVINDTDVLLNDQNDIWQVSLSKARPPLNLTNSFGKMHKLFFENIQDGKSGYSYKEGERMICSAFDRETKANGFYSVVIGSQKNPQFLSMQNSFYHSDQGAVGIALTGGRRSAPIKASDANVFIVKRGKAELSDNYFCTTDFKRFIAITTLTPEKKYNWFTSELHTWKSLSGINLKGVLFKPENFNPEKEYPVIFYIYEQLSDNLNISLRPDFTTNGSAINIPSFVSNGYLVFIPDIKYEIGDPMQGTYDAIVSCANYLSGIPYVDSKKMGLQGGSWGGIQANYVVSHTNKFAAVCSAVSIADLISGYGSFVGTGARDISGSNTAVYELGQTRMGGTLTEKPFNYIKNSPIFSADKVETPLLMMGTTDDPRTPFLNALEFFISLRRAGKKVWMLEYMDGAHGVSGKLAEDYGIRMQQFFDFYLKDKATPRWMLDGLPSKINDFELDTTGRRPGPGLLTEDEQKKVDAYSKIPLEEKLKKN